MDRTLRLPLDFSVEAPEGVRFLIRSRLFTEAEALALAAEGDPPTGTIAD